MTDSKNPLARLPARALISRSWPTGCRGLLPGRPELSFNSKLRTPIAVLDGPFQKASFYHQFFTLLQICRRKEEVRSKTGRPAGQTHFRKSIKKCQHSRKNRMQKPPEYFCRARLRRRGAPTNPSLICPGSKNDNPLAKNGPPDNKILPLTPPMHPTSTENHQCITKNVNF